MSRAATTRAGRTLTTLLPLRPAHRHLPAAPKTTSAQHVAARHIDHTFEKLMQHYKHYLLVVSVQDLILASPDLSLPLPLPSSASQKLRLPLSAPHFLRRFPHVFSLRDSAVRLTPSASSVALEEAAASSPSPSVLVRLLSLSPSRTVPLRAVFKVWKELGLPDDFERSVVSANPRVFRLRDNPRERNTHLLSLADGFEPAAPLRPAVENWRDDLRRQAAGRDADGGEIEFGFKQQFPPGMKLRKNFRAKVREWQRLPYSGPYDPAGARGKKPKAMEKRAVGIVHEFLSLTVEKTVEVEKISQFRRWFGVELNVRDLFLDHPGIFYLSTKGKRHTVFLREAYDRGRLVEPNPVYVARRKLLDLVMRGRRGTVGTGGVGGGFGDESEFEGGDGDALEGSEGDGFESQACEIAETE